MTWHEHKGLRVPWVAIWTGEKIGPAFTIEAGKLVPAARSELTRREDGMWMINVPTDRKGEPDFGATHSARQRRAMRHLLCQVCGEHKEVLLWVIPDDEPHRSLWDAHLAINAPVCPECLDYAKTHCPHLMRNQPYFVGLADADRTHVTHISGHFYAPTGKVEENVMLPLSSDMKQWMVGRELIVTVDR